MSEVARQIGVHRRTIARAVERGELTWHGNSSRGRYAKGILLPEALEACAKPERQAKRPVAYTVAKGFADTPAADSDRARALAILVQATVGGSDADMLACAIQWFRDGDHPFQLALLGIPVSAKMLGKGRRWVADELLACAGEASPKLVDLRFNELWRMLAREWMRARLDAEPAIVYDELRKTAEVGLYPRWVDRAPAGIDVPVLGGRVSVAEPRRRAGRVSANRAATKLMLAVAEHGAQADPENDLAGAYQALAGCAIEGRAVLRTGTLFAGRERRGLRTWLAEQCGLTDGEAQALLVRLRWLNRDALAGRTRQVGEADGQLKRLVHRDGRLRQPGRGTRLVVRYPVAAQVFGTSRQTFSKWVRRAMQEAQGRG